MGMSAEPLVSAVVLTAGRYEQPAPPGCALHVHVSRFGDAAGLLAARLAAVAQVRTPWFFFLDDDDALPTDFARVLALCLAAAQGQALAYTDELALRPGQPPERLRRQPWSLAAHLQDVTLLHHLALCRTEAAQAAAQAVPHGAYGFEPLVYGLMALRGGAAYVPEVGYHWRAAGGLHRRADVRMGMVKSLLWLRGQV